MKNIKYIVKLITIALLIAGQSCTEDFLNEYPSISQTPDNIQTIADAQIVMNGSYDLIQNNNYYNANMITDNDVRADDMQTADEGRIDDEYLYRYTAQADFDAGSWSHPHAILRHVNTILTFIDDIAVLRPEEEVQRSDIKGQALAIRALVHFDLCRQFGRQYSHDNGASLGVPIVTSILDPYAKVSRNTVAEVYAQVIADLQAAIPLLNTNKRLGQLNAWAAKTLLARVYLYMEDNANAYTTALDVIDNGPYTLMARNDYVDSWSLSGGSSESIFSIINNAADNGGGESVNNLSDPGGYGQFVATQDLIDLMRSDPDDIRMQMMYVCQVAIKQNPNPLAHPTTWGR
ncbi:RagB/SusD family nutrient uptake outer membrane protein, partial [Bacteroidota bacterium]